MHLGRLKGVYSSAHTSQTDAASRVSICDGRDGDDELEEEGRERERARGGWRVGDQEIKSGK